MSGTTPSGTAGEDAAVYAVLDAAPGAVVTVDATGVIDYLNDVAVETFGYPREELLGRPVEMLVPPGLVDRHVTERRAFAARPRAHARARGLELRGRRKDGSEFPAEINLTPFEAAGGFRVVATVTDISARRDAEARMQTLTRAYRSLAEMNEAIVRATDDLELFSETCRVAVEEAGYLGAWIATVDPDGRIARVASAGALDDYVDQLVLSEAPGSAGGDVTSRMVQLGVAQYTDQATPAERVRGIEATAALPLRRRGDVVGALTVYARRSEAFDDQVRGLLEGAAENISYALDVLDRAATLRDVARQRSLLSRRLIDAQEAERARIAADVHDESVQSLAAAVLRLGLVERRVAELAPESVPHVSTEFDRLHQTLDAVTSGLRELLFELETGDLEASLAELVEDAAQHIFEHATLRWAVVVDSARADLRRELQPSDRRQALRIVKEALINTRKHASASEVVVTIRPGSEGVELVVQDDGLGFDVSTSPRGHRGLVNMHDRAAVSGGWCRIERAEPGTVVRVWLPYDAGAGAPGTTSPVTPSH